MLHIPSMLMAGARAARTIALTCAVAVVGIGAADSGTGAVAQEAAQPPIVSSLAAHVVTRTEDGEEVLSPAGRVNPGDTIEYRIAHLNQSGAPLADFIVNGRIPNGTVFVAGSAGGKQTGLFEVMVRGEADWQSLPAFKTVTDENGKDVRVEAGPEDYTAIRWRIRDAVADGAGTENVYRVTVSR